jgi:Fe-S cluster biogenesis protein NfuA
MDSKEKEALMERAEDAVKQLRPFLEADGGDLALVDITDEAIIQVELKGTCRDCSMNQMTFRSGIRDAIMRAVPELKGVEGVNFEFSA